MTNLDRPVRRRTREAYPVLRPKAEKIVVTLAPGDLLVFRKERGRQTWSLPIEAAFRAAVHRQAARDAADKNFSRRRGVCAARARWKSAKAPISRPLARHSLDVACLSRAAAHRRPHVQSRHSGRANERTLRWHELKLLFHGGDFGEPCATVMLPDED